MPDPFALLDLPRRFDLDEAALHRRFIRLSSQHHPDRFADPLEQADAADRAAAVNQAYRQLRNPMTRAMTLLDLLSNTQAAEGDKDALPADFLMEVMERRESLEAALEAQDQPKLAALRQWAEDQRQTHLARVAQALTPLEAEAASAESEIENRKSQMPLTLTPAAIQQVRQDLNVLRYLDRMLEQMP